MGTNKEKVRGAPAIAIVAALSVAVELSRTRFVDVSAVKGFIDECAEYLRTARPTAVNLGQAMTALVTLATKLESENTALGPAILALRKYCEGMLEQDVADNTAVGNFGAEALLHHVREGHKVRTCPVCFFIIFCVFHVLSLRLWADSQARVLTHCNTGSLASGGYGTALGVVRSLHHLGKLDHVFFTETRPYNQGARLTAFELMHEHIPCTLIADSMAAILMERKDITAVVVGADRVAANGDTANKIGTYMLAIVAKHHGVPFYVAAPSTSIDLSRPNGAAIPIEERHANELLTANGVRHTPAGLHAWNPVFDVTPAALISGIITEKGVARRLEGVFDMAGFLQGH